MWIFDKNPQFNHRVLLFQLMKLIYIDDEYDRHIRDRSNYVNHNDNINQIGFWTTQFFLFHLNNYQSIILLKGIIKTVWEINGEFEHVTKSLVQRKVRILFKNFSRSSLIAQRKVFKRKVEIRNANFPAHQYLTLEVWRISFLYNCRKDRFLCKLIPIFSRIRDFVCLKIY